MDALMDGPAGVPPAGVVPNLNHPDNKNGLALFVIVFCSVISTICVLLRTYGKCVLLKSFKAEEALIFSAYGIFWGCVWSMLAFMDKPGYFVHAWDVRMRDLIPMTYYMFVMGTIYVIVLMLLKVAMLVEWARILVPRASRTGSIFWWSCMTMIALQAGACIGLVITLQVQCIPHQASWDFTITNAKCFPLYNVQLASGIIYLATDIIMFFMPQQIIWNLQMSWQKKLGVSVVFGLGLLACVAAGFRLHVTIDGHHNTADSTYSVGEMIFWVMAEMTIGFFVTCAPTIPKIMQETGCLRQIKKTFASSQTGHTNKGTGYGGNTFNKGGSVLNSVNRVPNPTTTSNVYYKLDEDGVPLGELKGSESTEYLRREEKKAQPPPAGRGHITRTTRIDVEEAADDAYARREPRNNQQWAA